MPHNGTDQGERGLLTERESVLADLEEQAARMERECKHPPCPHAWGIRHAVEVIREREATNG